MAPRTVPVVRQPEQSRRKRRLWLSRRTPFGSTPASPRTRPLALAGPSNGCWRSRVGMVTFASVGPSSLSIYLSRLLGARTA
jgi:hypothetical protein